MPCFVREKSLAVARRQYKKNDRDPLAPKPVHPRALRFHGLFGMSNVRQHSIVDDRWTPNSLTEEFGCMADMLNRRLLYKSFETKANRERYSVDSKRLKSQCRDGRIKLHKILSGDSTQKIQHFLINHRDMQRLYQRMPIHMVVDNINQRTFVMRKERDRLEFRLDQHKREYRKLLLDRAVLENRIKYQNEFALEEEIQSRVFLKKMENSNVRLKAIKTINNTYKKIIQVLVHDEIFYEPILRSLSNDMEDQSNFIKHILYLGKPAIVKFKELNFKYRQLEDKSRKNLLAKLQMSFSLSKAPNDNIVDASALKNSKDGNPASANPKRYVRNTQSMTILKHVLKAVEHTIKEVKFVTLCSQAKEIYPRMKSQVDNNEKLHRLIESDMLAHEVLEVKMKCTTVLKGVLVNNLSEEEINRLERINDLRKMLAEEKDFEQKNLLQIRNRGNAYVTLRVCIWNLVEILRHVDRSPKSLRTHYPNSYLKLPLLKFEMLNMHAAAPELYEENIEKVMHLLKRKVYKLMKAYLIELRPNTIKRNREEYHFDYLASRFLFHENEDGQAQPVSHEDILLNENKTMGNVPNRNQIKVQSAKFIEEMVAKRDEE